MKFDGDVDVRFSEEMLAPKNGTQLDPSAYNNLLDVFVESYNDQSRTKGMFSKNDLRILEIAEQIEGEAKHMTF